MKILGKAIASGKARQSSPYGVGTADAVLVFLRMNDWLAQMRDVVAEYCDKR